MLAQALDHARKLHQSLEPRERKLVLVAVLLLLPAVLVFAWLEPLLESRQDSYQRLERLEAERATMQALSQQWRSLDQQAPAAKLPDLETRMKASLNASEGLEDLKTKVLENGSILVESASVDQNKLMPWLVNVRKETQSQWAEFRIERSQRADHLKLRLRFVDAAGQKS